MLRLRWPHISLTDRTVEWRREVLPMNEGSRGLCVSVASCNLSGVPAPQQSSDQVATSLRTS